LFAEATSSMNDCSMLYWKTLLSYGTCDVIPHLRNLCPGVLGI